MMMHEGTTDFLKLVAILAAIGGFLFWLRHDFGSNVALGSIVVFVILTFGTIMFVIGSKHSARVQKDTLDGISKFNAQDATIDRYRMQSLRVLAQGDSAKQKAESQLKVIEAKKDLKLLPKSQSEDQTFWSTAETVDLDEWS